VRFWDTSALVPLVVRESASPTIERLLLEDERIVVWWSTLVEFEGALARRVRSGNLAEPELTQARTDLSNLLERSVEIEPTVEIRKRAVDLLYRHDLRSADALQLASALSWADENPAGADLVCLDARFRDAAASAGFTILPADLSLIP
jgi:uncharacterized protein